MTGLIVPKWTRYIKKLTYNHGEDPKKVVLDALGDALSCIPAIYGNQVLVATAPSLEKIGNIVRPDGNLKEDQYQGKVGLILGWGPSAFKYDPEYPNYPWEGPAPVIGDWVFYRTSDSWECGLNGVSCRFIKDAWIKGQLIDPEAIW